MLLPCACHAGFPCPAAPQHAPPPPTFAQLRSGSMPTSAAHRGGGRGPPSAAQAALAAHPEVKRRIDLAFDRANEQLARFEQVKYHQVLARDFSIEEGTLTPTMKLKRRRIVELYGDRIDGLYDAGPSPGI